MISVLIPVFNTPRHFLEDCINSCLHQTLKDYELVIVDNGSTNQETIDVLNSISDNKKINIFNCPRQEGKNNISIAMNLGLKNSKYDLVARMDSDDIMLHDRLEKQINFMNQNINIDIVGAQMKVFPDNYITNHPRTITKDIVLNSSWFINHPTVAYRKDKILNLGGYPVTPEFGAEDYMLWMMSFRAGLEIANMDDVVLFYRSHGQNLTRKREKHQSYYQSIEAEKIKSRKLLV